MANRVIYAHSELLGFFGTYKLQPTPPPLPRSLGPLLTARFTFKCKRTGYTVLTEEVNLGVCGWLGRWMKREG